VYFGDVGSRAPKWAGSALGKPLEGRYKDGKLLSFDGTMGKMDEFNAWTAEIASKMVRPERLGTRGLSKWRGAILRELYDAQAEIGNAGKGNEKEQSSIVENPKEEVVKKGLGKLARLLARETVPNHDGNGLGSAKDASFNQTPLNKDSAISKNALGQIATENSTVAQDQPGNLENKDRALENGTNNDDPAGNPVGNDGSTADPASNDRSSMANLLLQMYVESGKCLLIEF
jgi:hypothetical protein